MVTADGNIDAYVGHDGTAELHAHHGTTHKHQKLSLLSAFAFVLSPANVYCAGTVSVRVPSTIKTGVQLCGTSVDISSEIACQETERTSSDGKAAVTGE